MYHLHRALNAGRIDLDRFLRVSAPHTLTLARTSPARATRRDRLADGIPFRSLIRTSKPCRAARRPVPRIDMSRRVVVSCRRRRVVSHRVASCCAAPRRDADRAGARGGAVHEARADREDTRGDPHGRVDGRRVVMSARRAPPMRCDATRCDAMRWWVDTVRCGVAVHVRVRLRYVQARGARGGRA